MHRSLTLFACAIVTVSWTLGSSAAEPDRTSEEKAIRAAAQEYVAALARGDAKVALSFWTADGDIVDEAGRRSTARERIELDAASAAKSNGQAEPAAISETTIRFLGPDTAIEDGSYGASGRFSAVWSKSEGRWRLASLREARDESQTLNNLAELKWLVGHWIGEHDGTTFDITARWNQAETYLERHLIATHNGTVLLDAEQRIGVDPEDGQVKCWTHDAEGGHSEGVWSHQGTSWIVESRGVTADGEDLRGTSVYTPQAENQISWQSLNNWRGGRPMLDYDVTLTRAAEK